MGSTAVFWVSFVATLVLLGATVYTGLRHRRRLHLVLAPATLVALTIAILSTEQLMRAREFLPATMRIHLPIAKTAGLLVLPVIATGIWLSRDGRARRWHRLAVGTFLLFVVAATVTGINAYVQSTPK